jgi:chromosome segregation ATPase
LIYQKVSKSSVENFCFSVFKTFFLVQKRFAENSTSVEVDENHVSSGSNCNAPESKPNGSLGYATDEATVSPSSELTGERQSPPLEDHRTNSMEEQVNQTSDELSHAGSRERDLEQQLCLIVDEKSSLEVTVQQLREELEKHHETIEELEMERQKWRDAEKLLSVVADDKRCLEERIQQLTADLAALHEELSTARLSLQEASFCEAAYQDILRDKSELEDKFSCLTNELQRSVDSIAVITEESTKCNDRLVEALSQMTKWELENDRLTKELSETRQQLTDYKQRFDELQREKTIVTEVAQKAECDRRMELSSLSERVAQLEGELRTKSEECSDLQSQIITQQGECSKIFADYEKQLVENGRMQDKIAKLEELSGTIEVTNAEKERLQGAYEKLQKDIVETEAKWHEVINEKQHTIAGLNDDLEALSGSVQRRERMWESARERMEQEILSLQTDLNKRTAEYQTKLKVSISDNHFLNE